LLRILPKAGSRNFANNSPLTNVQSILKKLGLHCLAAARSLGIRDGAIIAAAMAFAGSLDYLVHIVVGRALAPAEYGIFVSVTSLVQILIFLSATIRSVVSFYTAELVNGHSPDAGVSALAGQAWRWAWRWGLVGTAFLMIVSPWLTKQLNLPTSSPMWATCGMVLLLSLRQVTHGLLQGTHQFSGLGFVQIVQAFLRLLFAAMLVWVGTHAVGALAAQTLSCAVAVAVAAWWLRPYLRTGAQNGAVITGHSYPLHTFIGIAAFGVLTNLDALFVKHFYSPTVAGDYGPVSTLARISIFLPWSIGLLILPKVRMRLACGQETRPILKMGILAALLPGLILTGAYLLFPGAIVRVVFGSQYANPGIVLALANLATTLFAGLYIWLNYALALNQPSFVYGLSALVVLQTVGMYGFGRQNLVALMLTMIAVAGGGHLLGFVTAWPRRQTIPSGSNLVPSEQ